MFKSYYVVWKRLWALPTISSPKSFKSYYVVWKLEIAEQYIYTSKRFKSYYVVWKQYPGNIVGRIVKCLNRTM